MKDNVIKDGDWKFDEEVAKVFPNMLERSIPNYLGMRNCCNLVLEELISGGKVQSITEIGASRGGAISKFVDRVPEIRLYDNSPSMIGYLREDYGDHPNVFIHLEDLNRVLPKESDLLISVLTFMFLDVDQRYRILDRPFRYGLVVEKTQETKRQRDTYYLLKRINGYTEEQIAKKQESLEGVLVPWSTGRWAREFEDTGWSFELIWSTLQFRGWRLWR